MQKLRDIATKLVTGLSKKDNYFDASRIDTYADGLLNALNRNDGQGIIIADDCLRYAIFKITSNDGQGTLTGNTTRYQKNFGETFERSGVDRSEWPDLIRQVNTLGRAKSADGTFDCFYDFEQNAFIATTHWKAGQNGAVPPLLQHTLSPFETDVEKLRNIAPLDRLTTAERKAADLPDPIEIAAIREGGYSLFVGAHINDGLITWYGFDIERRLFIAVLGHMGHLLDRVPNEEKLNDSQLLRYTTAEGRRSEFVTVADASPEQAAEFSHLANKLLAIREEMVMPFALQSDTLMIGFEAIHNGRRLPHSSGRATYKAQKELERFIAKPLQEMIMQA